MLVLALIVDVVKIAGVVAVRMAIRRRIAEQPQIVQQLRHHIKLPLRQTRGLCIIIIRAIIAIMMMEWINVFRFASVFQRKARSADMTVYVIFRVLVHGVGFGLMLKPNRQTYPRMKATCAMIHTGRPARMQRAQHITHARRSRGIKFISNKIAWRN